MIAVVAAAIGLAASATASAGLLSAKGAVIAILGGELFVGEAEGNLNGAGTIAIHSQKDASLACVGDFTSSPTFGGAGQLSCSDGSRGTFQFQRLTVFRGHGTGNSSRGPMSFAYGLSAEEARPYLKVPNGKKLVQKGAELSLADS